MKQPHKHTATNLLAVVLMFGLTATSAIAQGKRADDAVRRSNKASGVIKAIMGAPDQGIPRDLIGRAEAVVVCPEVLKAALGIGGRRGQCVISRRSSSGWSTPVYYNMTGGSIGPQIGGEKLDIVLLVMNKDGVNGLLEDKFEIGGEAGVAAGPVGRTVSASTNATLDAGLLSYSRSKGAFIGAALKGVAITPDNDLNQDFYGKKASELLGGEAMTATPARVRTFPQTLSRYSKR
ncbi:MAG: lipid-binding SYLF domain-containing protein [Pyrinomonadaceae bacterium]|nr:lipid-binding SYLF domain-containing protein [Pyrinomonadaceae bacterium]MDQ3253648.1 lipid-binding SYLF domain-containing protein [Acidobacteriota bacterium]